MIKVLAPIKGQWGLVGYIEDQDLLSFELFLDNRNVKFRFFNGVIILFDKRKEYQELLAKFQIQQELEKELDK